MTKWNNVQTKYQIKKWIKKNPIKKNGNDGGVK